ncbi:WXG100 family type VII secretion target [Amycolatopsis australiensis]|uniref:Proteins of 100 residues with WXG n=1 Tax=Amycolatopsis australiensis TaxID=546364 RepID=A0A1K1R3U3_9PSEU|nr:hypothetical protein [Amycolatopsis australiensis]SFW66585.1 hypothetical protein SAMN04489730_2625 [Amycolatopsis australiensis]
MTETFNPTAAPDFGAGVVITDSNKFSGAGFLDSYTFLIKSCQDIQKADDADKAALGVAIGLGAVATVVDTVKFALNPLGSLISAGLGWLIEHISFLREPLDMLMGDPDQIQLLSQEVHTIAESIRKIADDQTASLTGEISHWEGDGAKAFNDRMKELAADLESKAHGTDIVGYLIQTNMAIIAAVRSLFRDLITTVLGDIISTMLIALATAAITFGTSIVAGVTWCVTQATMTATSLASKLAAVLAQAVRSAGRIGDITKMLKTRPEASGAAGAGRGADDVAPPPPRVEGPPPREGTPPPREDDAGTPPPREDDAGTPPPREDDAGTPPPREDDDASSYHTANEDTPPPSPARDDDDASFHTANENPPREDAGTPPPREDDDASSYHTANENPPSTSPWTKKHEDWLKQHQPDAYALYKRNETWLKEHDPKAFNLLKNWVADSDSAKELWAWPVKGSQEIIKQMLDIQKTAETGWAAANE